MTTPAAHELRLHLGRLRPLFDSLDRVPFRERDLDPKAAEYIADSAREAPSGAIALAQWLGSLIEHEGHAWLVSESLIIGGWVALWRPMEIFLYDWWPIRADARLFDRLAAMPIALRGADAAAGGAV